MDSLSAWILVALALVLPGQEREAADLFDLVAAGRLEVAPEGRGITAVTIAARSTRGERLRVRVPAGTFLVSSDAGVQDMVALRDSEFDVQGTDWVSHVLMAACASRTRRIPGEDARFTLQRAPDTQELAQLAEVVGADGPDWKERQAAVWIVTDDANDEEIAKLLTRSPGQTSGGQRTISELDTIGGMMLCERAGIDLARKAVWRDRWALYSHARARKDQERVRWFESRGIDFEATLATLADPDPELRREALVALARIRDARAVAPTIAALADPAAEVRSTAAHVLQYHADPSAVEPLLSLLRDESSGVRASATQTLGKLQDSRALPALVELLVKEDDYGIGNVLVEIGDPAVVGLLVEVYATLEPRDRETALEVFAVFPDRLALDAILGTLENGEPDEREAAAKTLRVFSGAHADPRVVPALLAATDDVRRDVCDTAVYALGVLGDPAAIDVLVDSATNEREKLRRTALWALAKFEDPRPLAVLVRALQDEVPHVREIAAAGLDMYGNPEALPALIAAFSDEVKPVRSAAAKAVITLAGERAIEPLIGLLEDPTRPAHAKLQASATLRSITGQPLGEDPALWRAWQRAGD